MKILHTADLHLGQVIYQNYDRDDEHQHFFRQLKGWCLEHQPDALLVSGDVFDIQHPSSSIRATFNGYFADLHRACPKMKIVITAGNHDSASRLQADSSVWALADVALVGTAPQSEPDEGWEEKYVVRLPCGYIVAMPYMTSERPERLQQLLDFVARENLEGKPVVMMGHAAVTGLDLSGHPFEVGKLKTQEVASFGTGYDYLALGHIHKPQTIGHQEDALKPKVSYPTPVIRYSGSALHVSCDETYPHTVSLVELDSHGGEVKIEQLRINELRHFYELPTDGSSIQSAEEAREAVEAFCREDGTGYIRLRIDQHVDLPSDFNQWVYDLLATTGDEVRYNPKVIWTGATSSAKDTPERLTFEVAELQQMTNPLNFVERVIDQYPNLSLDEVREAFDEVEGEIRRMQEADKTRKAASKEASPAPAETLTTDDAQQS